MRDPNYEGPERRKVVRDPTVWLTRMLDEIDYGMLLVRGQTQLSYLNQAARLELDDAHPLQRRGHEIGARRIEDVAAFFEAMAAAQRGLRRLLTLGEGEQRVSVSVLPLPTPEPADGSGSGFVTLLMLGKRPFQTQPSVHGYARSQKLTPAETRVLDLLCEGKKPGEIAALCQVQVATVRSQIGSIRAKTGASSIRELLRQVAVLPALVGAQRRQPLR